MAGAGAGRTLVPTGRTIEDQYNEQHQIATFVLPMLRTYVDDEVAPRINEVLDALPKITPQLTYAQQPSIPKMADDIKTATMRLPAVLAVGMGQGDKNPAVDYIKQLRVLRSYLSYGIPTPAKEQAIAQLDQAIDALSLQNLVRRTEE